MQPPVSKLAEILLPPLSAIGVAIGINAARSFNMRAVRHAFRRWSAGEGSLFDLMIDDALIVIPGTSPHCGSFRKSMFVNDIAKPFMARFTKPPTPRPRKIWSDGNDVAVLADAEGTTRDGMPYANNYLFVLKLRGGRITQATEFLDMAAFNAVWDRVEPASVDAAERG